MKLHTLYIDTREQRALSFAGYSGIFILRKKLDFGDYGMRFSDGWTVPVVFERKSIPDVFGTLTKGHDRFKRELARSKKNGYKLMVIIEGPIAKVIEGVWKSKIQGIAIVRSLFTYLVKYDVYLIFAKDREEASRFIIEYYSAMWRKRKEEM